MNRQAAGLLAFITNHGYLDNPTFRGMRQQLMNTFSDIYILDLHGNQKKKETCPDGSKDVNVFDIQQGVSIAIFVKEAGKKETAKIHHADLYGLRKNKYEWLSENDIEKTDWKEAKPQKPFYLFTPQDTKSLNEFDKYQKITDVMKLNVLGFQTHRDDFAIDFDKDTIYQRVNEMRSQKISEQDFRQKHNLQDNRDWKLEESRQNIRMKKNWEKSIVQCLYRPFDKRFCYFDEIAMDYPRRELKDHVAGRENLCLGLGRQGIAVNDPEWALISISKEPIDANIFRRGGINVFPLYLYSEADDAKGKQKEFLEKTHWDKSQMGRVPNLSVEFVEELAEKIGLDFVSDGRGDLGSGGEIAASSSTPRNDVGRGTFGPEDILHYIYAVFHSPEYRRRYAEFLKIDFPRVPMPAGKEIFVELCGIGERLCGLHLMEAEILEDEKRWPGFNIEGSGEVEKGYPKYVADADKPGEGKVYINKDQYFEGVEPAVWEFNVGGYQVCEKWLKDRRGRKLVYDDIKHYQKITVSLRETLRLMKSPCLVEMFKNS